MIVLGLTIAASIGPSAQTPRVVPRPPAQPPGATPAGSTAPDGYAPVPEWAGQTRARANAPRARAQLRFAGGSRSLFDVETVATGIMNGFAFHFLPDRLVQVHLVTERPGRLRIIDTNGRVSQPLAGLPTIFSGGPQGLFEAIPDRAFANNRVIFFTFTARPAGDTATPAPRLAGHLMVARARLAADDSKLEDVKVLLDAEGIGGRLIQAPDATLLITSSIPAGVGINSADWPQPQQLDSLMGKVLRINTDGSIPRDNPFVGREGARPEIYALGIRDDQGVAIHPRTGQLWVSEHGPRGGDEINAIAKGKNYGFPVIGYGHDYNGKAINQDRTAQAGMEQPVYFWTPDIAPAGISFYTGKLFPGWQQSLFVGALAGKHLVRLVLNGERVTAEERLLTELDSRIRDVQQGPDGALYVMTDRDGGRIVRLVPKKN